MKHLSIIVSFLVLSSLAFAIPHPREGIFLKDAEINVHPYAKKGHCRVFFKLKERIKNSGEISCKFLYSYLKHELGNYFSSDSLKLRIEAAQDFNLRIHLYKGKIISHRKNAMLDEFYVSKGTINLADHPDLVDKIYKEQPMRLNLDKALKEIEETLK